MMNYSIIDDVDVKDGHDGYTIATMITMMFSSEKAHLSGKAIHLTNISTLKLECQLLGMAVMMAP